MILLEFKNAERLLDMLGKFSYNPLLTLRFFKGL